MDTEVGMPGSFHLEASYAVYRMQNVVKAGQRGQCGTSGGGLLTAGLNPVSKLGLRRGVEGKGNRVKCLDRILRLRYWWCEGLSLSPGHDNPAL